MSTILWTDDREHLVQDWIQACEALGHTVYYARNRAESERIAREHGPEVDLALFDLVMPEIGGRTLAAHLSSYMPRAKNFLVTTYPDVVLPGDANADQDETMLVVDREEIPEPNRLDRVGAFVDGLISGKDRSMNHVPALARHRGVVDITYDEYMNESFDGRLAFNEEAEKDPRIESLLREKKFYWMLVCGDEIFRASTPNQVLSTDKILEVAQRQNRAPYQFFSEMLVDDVSPAYCEPDLVDYPYMSLKLSADVVLDVHYDTGNYENLLKFESVVAFVPEQKIIGTSLYLRGRRLKAWTGTISRIIVENPLTSGTEIYEHIDVVLVKEWEETVLVKERPCGIECKNRKSLGGGRLQHCYYRQHGLLGRRIQRSIGKCFLISNDDPKVILLDGDQLHVLSDTV